MIILIFLAHAAAFLLPAAGVGAVAASLAKRSQDEWKLLAWVPVLPVAIWGIVIAWQTTRDPTSHNLWPFELIIWGALSGAMLVLFLIARAVARRSESRNPPWTRRRRKL